MAPFSLLDCELEHLEHCQLNYGHPVYIYMRVCACMHVCMYFWMFNVMLNIFFNFRKVINVYYRQKKHKIQTSFYGILETIAVITTVDKI